MKGKRSLAFLMALLFLVTLGTAVFAAGDSDQISVFFPPNADLSMTLGDSTKVKAIVYCMDSGADYDWRCTDPSVVSISGSQEKVTVKAVGVGRAEVSLTVTSSDGQNSDFAVFSVTVDAAVSKVSVKGGGTMKPEAGETTDLSATVSGGSGSYVFEWDVYGDASLTIVDKMRNNASVHAGKSGTGTVLLTVYDAEDYNNNDTVSWEFKVSSGKKTKAPEVRLSRGSVDLGVGASGTLRAEVTGGSGDYDYTWSSDNRRVVSVDGHGEIGDIYAADTLSYGSNTAEITLRVYDRESGLSGSASCIVHVSGGESVYNAYDYAEAGDTISMSSIAKDINAAFRKDFGSSISYSASVKFTNASSKVGSLRLQDDTAVRSGTSYTYATFQDMLFWADASGSFHTDYMIVDGSDVISGTIYIEVEGSSVGIKSASLSDKRIQMPTYSNEYLTLSVSPSNARYTVDWEVTGSSIVTVAGSGNKVTLKSSGRTGTTTVTATIVDTDRRVITRSCDVTVYEEDEDAVFDTSLTVMLGSDYYGSKLSDSMASKFKKEYGVYPADGATITFPSLGNSVYGALHMKDGSTPSKNKNYTFRDWVEMYFTPYAKGTYKMEYKLTYKGDTMTGEIKIIIEAASMTVTMDPTALEMSAYSTRYINLDIAPSSSYYQVTWASTDTDVVTVSGSNATAIVTSVGPGTATVTAIVTDLSGVEIRKACTVVVKDTDTVFNPSVATTIGIPYMGTGTSTAMRSQYAALYGIPLEDTAIITFASAGNNDVGIMRLADGSTIQPNTGYTLSQYVAMYTEPVSAGTFSVPYELTFAGKKLTGTVSVVISGASISTDIKLPVNGAYSFADALSDTTGAAILSRSVSNTVGANWGYLRFGSVSGEAGTLYLDKNATPINSDANITPELLEQLYFVPGQLQGTFSAPYTVYTTTGEILATGTLNITRPASRFTDVPDDSYYARAVTWAIGRGITSGTSETTFSPDSTVTRGQAVTFLWRAAGQPKSAVVVNPFTDVSEGAYYYDAVLWAVQQGLTNGTSETTFSPDNLLNRDQLLALLYRANGGGLGGANWSSLAVDWANGRGLLDGVPGEFVAASPCPRSDVIYYIWKYYNG